MTVPLANPVPMPAVIMGGAVAGLAAAGVGLSLLRDGAGRDPGGWASRRDLRTLKPAPGTVTLGRVGHRPVALQHRSSLLILGPTQSGKTTRLVIPAVAGWPGPVICASVKRDVLDGTRASRTGPTWVLDPSSSMTDHWSPTTGCGDWHRALQTAEWISEAGRKGGGRDMDFWNATATKMLGPLLVAAATGNHSVSDILAWVDGRQFELVANLIGGGRSPEAERAWLASISRESKQLSSVLTTVETILAAWSEPSVAACCSHSDFTPSEVMACSGAVYLCAPAHEQSRLRSVTTTFIHSVLAYAFEHPADMIANPLLLVLDEAMNISPLEDLPTIASTCAGLGVQLVTVCQDVSQLKARYHDSHGSVISNHRAIVALPGSTDLETLDLLSRLCGDVETPRQTTTSGPGRASVSRTTEHRRLLPIEALRRLPSALLLYGTLPPARLVVNQQKGNEQWMSKRSATPSTSRAGR